MVRRKSPPPGCAAAANAPESLLEDLLFVSKTERRPPELAQARRRSSPIAELRVSIRPNDIHLPRRSGQTSNYERVERPFLYSRRYRAPEVAGKRFALLSSRDEIALVVLCADCCRRRTNVGTKCSPVVLGLRISEQRICHAIAKSYMAEKSATLKSLENSCKIICPEFPDISS